MKNSSREKRIRRHQRIRTKIKGTASRPRLAIFRSNQHIYVQVIDDLKGKTLVAASDKEVNQDSKKKKMTKTIVAKEVGKLIALKAQKANISSVVLDRGGFNYHGRVKALAEGAREGGLKF